MLEDNASRYFQLSISDGGETFTSKIALTEGSGPTLITINEYDLEFNADNTPNFSGPIEGPRYQLAFEKRFTPEQYRNFSLIHKVMDYKRRTSQDPGITVDIVYRTIEEFGPRTRPIAFGTEEAIGANGRRYYPRLKMVFTEYTEPERMQTQEFEAMVRCQLTEIDRFAP